VEVPVIAGRTGSFRYSFIFFGRFNPTKAIMGTSTNFHN
jgi:hypothetical protein